jgi:hypothetical protein
MNVVKRLGMYKMKIGDKLLLFSSLEQNFLTLFARFSLQALVKILKMAALLQ